MLKNNGKELIFSKSFLMERGDRISIRAPELQGAELLFKTREYTGQEDAQGITAEAAPTRKEIAFTLPARNEPGYSGLPILKMGELPEGPISGHILARFFGPTLLVQIDLYVERK